MDLLKQAMGFAANAHAGQFRKDRRTPYIVHPANVALAAARYDLPLEVQAAALLHDVLEDTDITKEELQNTFPAYTVQIVAELTNESVKPEHAEKPRAERKSLDRAKLATVSKYAKMIKMLDRIDNLQDLSNDYSQKFIKLYLTESEALLKVLASANDSIAHELMGEIIIARERLCIQA